MSVITTRFTNTYQALVPWQVFVQVLLELFQPGGFPLAMFMTPFECVEGRALSRP